MIWKVVLIALCALISSTQAFTCSGLHKVEPVITNGKCREVPEETSRRGHMGKVLGIGIGLLSLEFSTPVNADSTGKYSTKQTAKRRYLPRIKKGVKAFQELGKTLDKPETVKGFEQYVEDNLGTALNLYGASTRIGELPDPKSRTLEKEVEDFIKDIKDLSNSGNDKRKTYESAKVKLSAYLEGAKLEPLYSKYYDEP